MKLLQKLKICSPQMQNKHLVRKSKILTKVTLTNWFDHECGVARNAYHNIRKLYNKHKTVYFKNLKTVSKEYKNTISKSVKRFKNQRVEKLRNLKTSKPREFWKIINSVDKRRSQVPPFDELHTFLKNLNSNESEQTAEGIK